jgi:hypothetical protein
VATPTAWLLNLDADVELADPRRYRGDPAREARIRGLYARMQLLTDARDRVLDADTRALAAHMRVLAFCPTPSALARIAALGLEPPAAPALEVLQTANSRAFCAELGQTLDEARYVSSMEMLERAIQDARQVETWVLKRPFGFAGSERRRITRGVLDPSTRGFAERRFRAGRGLQLEPWLRRGHDFALHGYLSAQDAGTARLHVGPLIRQHCDPMGRWLRSERCAPDALAPEHLRLLRHELERSAEGLRALGYFGPFGIDAFEYENRHGQATFQPRSEINARFSMGYPRELLERALEPA